MQFNNYRTWVEIDRLAIKDNIKNLKSFAGQKIGFLLVVKANAYGHGIVEIAKFAVNCGIYIVGVAYLDEAKKLRESGFQKQILLLIQPPITEIPEIVNNKITPTVTSLEFATRLSEYCQKNHYEQNIHIDIDTGMGNLSVPYNNAMNFISKVRSLKNLNTEGISTGFADADNPNNTFTLKQDKLFKQLISDLKTTGFNPKFIHAPCSSAIFSVPLDVYNLARIGSAIYGIQSSIEKPYLISVKSALSWKTRILGIKYLPKNSTVGYGRTWKAKSNSKIAVIGIGYADGFRRSPSNFGQVLCQGKLVPVIGNVAMNQSIIDVSGPENVMEGDEIVIIGKQKDVRISVEDIAVKTNTICEEILTSISSTIPRIYID